MSQQPLTPKPPIRYVRALLIDGPLDGATMLLPSTDVTVQVNLVAPTDVSDPSNTPLPIRCTYTKSLIEVQQADYKIVKQPETINDRTVFRYTKVP